MTTIGPTSPQNTAMITPTQNVHLHRKNVVCWRKVGVVDSIVDTFW